VALSDSAVFCVGASHGTVPLDVLERLAIPGDAIPGLLRGAAAEMVQRGQRGELVLLSTCNRTEIYGVLRPSEPDGARPQLLAGIPQALLQALEERSGLTQREIAATMYRHDTGKAEGHLLRVITGQDSLIVGETQVIGQVARAYAAAQHAGTAGPALSLLFESAIRASRKTRPGARYAGGAASGAVERAARLAGPLPAARVLVIGTGETGRLLVQSQRQHGAGRVDVVTRSAERAADLSRRWGTVVHTTAGLPALLVSSDVVMCSTSSPVPLVSEAAVRAAVSERPARPLLFVDISVPRTVEKSAGLVPGVTLLDIDSLKIAGPVVDDPAVAAVITSELEALELRMAEMALRPVIGGMWRKADTFRAEVLERTRARVPELDDKAWEHIENLASALVAKILHDPATRLRAEAGNGHAREYADALRHLFALPDRQGPP
jgi:glutamyl-tRNA reductase